MRSKPIAIVLGGIAIAFLTSVATVLAQENSYTSTGFGKWEVGTNWSQNVPPASTQSGIFITNAFSKTVTIDATTAGSFSNTLTISNLTVSAPVGSHNTLFLDNSGLATPLQILNSFTIGSRATLFVFSNSVVHMVDATGTGSLVLEGFTTLFEGGMLIATNVTTTLGNTGMGEMTVTNSTLRVRNFAVGNGAGSQGTLRCNGGTMEMQADWWVGTGTGSAGEVLMNGGQLVASAFTVIGLSGTGRFTMSNGTVTAQSIIVGGNFAGTPPVAQGTLTIAGGTVHSGIGPISADSALTVGENVFASGSVLITGGQLIATNPAPSIGGSSVVVGRSGNGQLTISNGTAQIGRLALAVNPGSTGILTVAGGTLTIDYVVVTNTAGTIQFPAGTMTLRGAEVANGQNFDVGGTGQSAVLNLVGGTNRFANAFNVGEVEGSTGTVWMTGGELIVTNFFTHIGNDGIGQMTVSNGIWQAGTVIVGDSAGSHGTLRLAGGTNRFAGELVVGNALNAPGEVWLTGGQLIITNNRCALGDNGVARMTVSNGTWRARDVVVGYNAGSDGTLTLAGGTNVFSGVLSVGALAGSTGTLWMTGGQLIVTNNGIDVTEVGTGQMTVSNGTVLARGINLGDNSNARGTLTVAGGTVTVLSDLHAGFGGTQSLHLSGGQLNVITGLTSIGFFDVGQMTVSNGLWRTRDVIVGNQPGSRGTLTIAGGTSTVSSTMTLGDFACVSTGIVTMAGGSLFVTNVSASATIEVRSGTFSLSGGLLRTDKIILTNACAQFVRTGGTLIYGTAVLNPDDDTDGDDFSNQVEQDAGSDPLDASRTPINAGFPPGDVNGDGTVTGADSLLINQVLVGLRSSNDAIFATAGFDNGDVNATNGVNGADSLLVNQVIVGLRSYITTGILPGSHSSNQTTAVVIFGVGFPTNVTATASIGPPVNLTLTNVVVLSRERITAVVPPGGGLGTGTVNVISSPTNGVISFGRFINQ